MADKLSRAHHREGKMIKLYGFPAAFGLPSAGPFVIKTEILLQWAGLVYEVCLEGLGGAPKGRLPYIVDGDKVVADSTFIRLYLEKQYRADFDDGYSGELLARAWAVERMMEDHLYWAMVYSRWAMDENFAKGPARFFDHLPEDVQDTARQKQRNAVLGYLHGQGIGRHSIQEIGQLAEIGYANLARLLGENRYILGDKPCGADAAIFAQV